MSKKNLSEMEKGGGYFLGLTSNLMDVVREKSVPFAAIYRLATEGGRTTLGKIVDLAYADWQAEQPKPPVFVESAGGHPYRGGSNKPATNIVLVPDLAPADLVAEAEKKIGLTYINPSFKTWNFCQYNVAKGQQAGFLNVRGKRYEVLTWKPGKSVTTRQVRDHFKDLGADGNTAAFIAWIMETRPAGYHVSIPSDDDLLGPGSLVDLYAPYFHCDDAKRELHLVYVAIDYWELHWVFVAFREISS